MTVRELNREQLNELKCAYVCEMVENPSWGELANSIDIDDEIIFQHYDGICFSEDDFSCTASY